MKQAMAMKTVIAVLAGSLAFGAMADGPTVSDVVVRQRWPWNRLVDINYVLTCDPATHVDVSLTAYNGTSQLTLPNESLSGDLIGISQGGRRIVWDPTKTAYTNDMLTQFKVALTVTNSPVYMIVDLTNAVGTIAHVEYIYPGDQRLTTEGRYTNVWFDITNHSEYATDKLVLRRVHAGTFKMGTSIPPALTVTLTKDFYVGVFEVTQAQWKNITGSYPASPFTVGRDTRPAESMSYNDLRGSTSGSPVINWPVTGYLVTTNSFMGKLRAKTGISTFDLPTEAQWNCACRAGTTTVFNDGNETANVLGANAGTNEWLNVLGRYAWNGGKYWDGDSWENALSSSFGPSNGTAKAGTYQPNNWGVYDAQGNVWDFCLDWNGTLQGGTDPVGSSNGVSRMACGGRLIGNASDCVSSARGEIAVNAPNAVTGFRVVKTLP